MCAARDDLQTSITDLKDVNIVAGGTSSLQAAITKVKDNLTTLKSAAGDELQPEVTAAQDALTELQSALKDVSSGGVAAVVTAAAKVASTGGAAPDRPAGPEVRLTRRRAARLGPSSATSRDVGAACAAGRMCPRDARRSVVGDDRRARDRAARRCAWLLAP